MKLDFKWTNCFYTAYQLIITNHYTMTFGTLLRVFVCKAQTFLLSSFTDNAHFVVCYRNIMSQG